MGSELWSPCWWGEIAVVETGGSKERDWRRPSCASHSKRKPLRLCQYPQKRLEDGDYYRGRTRGVRSSIRELPVLIEVFYVLAGCRLHGCIYKLVSLSKRKIFYQTQDFCTLYEFYCSKKIRVNDVASIITSHTEGNPRSFVLPGRSCHPRPRSPARPVHAGCGFSCAALSGLRAFCFAFLCFAFSVTHCIWLQVTGLSPRRQGLSPKDQ